MTGPLGVVTLPAMAHDHCTCCRHWRVVELPAAYDWGHPLFRPTREKGDETPVALLPPGRRDVS